VSLLAIAWTIVAFLVGAAVVVLCAVMVNLFRVLTSTKDLIDGVTSQTVPLLGEVNTTVSMVNQELVRVDGILATAEGVTASVGGMVNTVSATISSPLVKLSAFAYGLRKAAGAASSDDQPSRGRRGWPPSRWPRSWSRRPPTGASASPGRWPRARRPWPSGRRSCELSSPSRGAGPVSALKRPARAGTLAPNART
jgi:uncharacterized protein YoxC